jgi:hypothetical protein
VSDKKDQEIFYRNVLVGHDPHEEVIVRAVKGFGTMVEVIIEGDLTDTTIRLSAGGAVALAKAMADAGDVALRS